MGFFFKKPVKHEYFVRNAASKEFLTVVRASSDADLYDQVEMKIDYSAEPEQFEAISDKSTENWVKIHNPYFLEN